MLKYIKVIFCILILLSINNVRGEYLKDLESIEAELLSDLSVSKQRLASISKYRDQLSEEEVYFLDLLRAHILLMNSEFEESEKLLETLEKGKASPGRKAMRYVLLAGIYHFRGQSFESFVATDKSLNLLPSIRRPFYKARVITNAVGLYKDADLLEYALEYGRRSLSVASKMKDEAAICSASYELAAIELLTRNYKQAENRLLKTKGYCEKSDYKIVLYAIDYSLFKLKLETGKLKEAREIAESLHPKIVAYDWGVLISASQSMFARLLLEEGNLREAKNYAMDAYKLSKSIGDKKRQQVAAGLLAKIYTQVEKDEEAIKYYKEYMDLNFENETRIRQRKLAFDIARQKAYLEM